MTVELFLQGLLKSQELSLAQKTELEKHKVGVTEFLRKEFGKDPVIKYAGSKAKGTMIQDNYDLDIVCYFPSSEERTLKEIKEDVSKRLSEKYTVESKASAERIVSLGDLSYHIDVVPGRFIEGTKDVFLYVAYGDKERIQTNLKTHIDHIVISKCGPIIRLVKLWTKRNNINIKTFVLELFVVDVLKGSSNKDNLEASFTKVLEALENNFSKAQIVDPANSNNIVSGLIGESEKLAVIALAKDSLEKIKEEDITGWEDMFNENPSEQDIDKSDDGNSSSSGFSPEKPWAL